MRGVASRPLAAAPNTRLIGTTSVIASSAMLGMGLWIHALRSAQDRRTQTGSLPCSVAGVLRDAGFLGRGVCRRVRLGPEIGSGA
jgi:hypothetical protein